MNGQTLAEKDARNGALQRAVNGYFERHQDDSEAACEQTVLEAIVALADDEHAEFPQYAGHYSGPEWALARVTKRVRSKGGVQFEAGDIVIVRPGRTEPEFDGDKMYPTAYSVRLGWDCSIRPNDFTLV